MVKMFDDMISQVRQTDMQTDGQTDRISKVSRKKLDPFSFEHK